MTTQPTTTYIYSDDDCVIKAMVDHPGTEEEYRKKYPGMSPTDYIRHLERAKSTAVKFADQDAAYEALCSNTSSAHKSKMKDKTLVRLQPNTIYTVERYEVGEIDMLQTRWGVEWHDLPGQKEGREPDGIYRTIKLATLKRIEPVVEHQESDHVEFDKYLTESRDCFVISINNQNWNTEMRTSAENLLIAYDQAQERLRKLNPPKQ